MAQVEFGRVGLLYNQWFATGAAALVFGGILSAVIVYGILFHDVATDLGGTAMQTGSVASVCWAVCFLGSPFSEFLRRYMSYRTLVILGSILTSLSILAASYVNGYAGLLVLYGLGYGLASNFVLHGVFCILYQHFPERYGALSTGIALCGSTAATLVLTVLFEHILPLGGWRLALRFNSLFAAVLAIPSSLLLFAPQTGRGLASSDRPLDNGQRLERYDDLEENSDDIDTRDTGERNRLRELPIEAESRQRETRESGKWMEVLRNPISWILFLAMFLPTLSWAVYWVNIVSYFHSLNIEGRCLSNLLTIIPIFELLGKFGIGVLAEAIPKAYLIVGHNLLFLGVSAAIAFFPFYEVLFVSTMLIAAGRGSYTVLPFAVMDKLFPVRDSGKAVTMTMVALGTGFTIGTIPAGAIFDITGSYTYAFVLNMAYFLLGSILLVVVMIQRRCSSRGRGQPIDGKDRSSL